MDRANKTMITGSSSRLFVSERATGESTDPENGQKTIEESKDGS
jgi:hypothetical protein